MRAAIKKAANSVLVKDSVTMPKRGHKQQIHDNKQKSHSKKLCKDSKEEISTTTTKASIKEQLNEFKRKNKEEYCNQNICSNAGVKDESVNNDQWPIRTTVTVGDSLLKGRIAKKVMWTRCLVKFKRFPASNVDDLSNHIIPII